MKVLDLQCSHAHVFEAWFASEQDFQDQKARGLLHCPLCDDASLTKLPSAPRLQLGSKPPVNHGHVGTETQASVSPTREAGVVSSDDQRQAQQAAWLSWSRKVMASTEDVGSDFPELARQMHQGDIPERPIRGASTLAQTLELLEEGVPVLPLSVAPAAKKTLQ